MENDPKEEKPHPIDDRVDAMIDEKLDDRTDETKLLLMQGLFTRQKKMYDDIKRSRRLKTIGFFIIVSLLTFGLIRQTFRADEICDSAKKSREVLHSVVYEAYSGEPRVFDLTQLAGYEKVQDEGVKMWIISLSELFSTSGGEGVPPKIQEVLDSKVC